MHGTWVIIAAMLALLCVGLLPRRQLRSPLLTALRVFFPSWRFFGAPGLEVELRVRTVDAEGTVSAWRDALTLARRPWHAVIWNPPATLRWSESSLVRDLLEQLEELEEVSIETIERLARFKLVDHLARSSLTTSPPPSVPVTSYELQIRSRREGEPDMTIHVEVPPRPMQPETGAGRVSGELSSEGART